VRRTSDNCYERAGDEARFAASRACRLGQQARRDMAPQANVWVESALDFD
jgi:hypothetical protein